MPASNGPMLNAPPVATGWSVTLLLVEPEARTVIELTGNAPVAE